MKPLIGGFTLIEIILVMAVVSILAAIAIPNLIELRNDAKDAVTKDRMQGLRRAIMGDSRPASGGTLTFPGFKADTGALPTALSELVSQGAQSAFNPITRKGWRGPYVDSSELGNYAKDAWGSDLEYSKASRYIRSYGANKTNNSGGGDDITLSF